MDLEECRCRPDELYLDCPVHGREARTLVVEAIDRDRLIAKQPAGKCELCGDVKETRPYGPNGEQVCFPCGMKDEDACKRAMDRRLAA